MVQGIKKIADALVLVVMLFLGMSGVAMIVLAVLTGVFMVVP